MLLEKNTDSVTWFFGITLAKIMTFSAPMSNFMTFQNFSGPLGTLYYFLLSLSLARPSVIKKFNYDPSAIAY